MTRVKKLDYTPYVASIYTKLRDKETQQDEFVKYTDKLVHLLLMEAMNNLPTNGKTVDTPTGDQFEGLYLTNNICAVSILRAGDSMLPALREVLDVPVGKILIQRDEETIQPKLFYSKLPPNMNQYNVWLLDPMVGTGGSANTAIGILKEKGVKCITFISILSCPEGLESIVKEHPDVSIITGYVDPGMNNKFYLSPGIGDFGDRYFGTT